MKPEEKAKELVEKFWHLDEECEIEDGFEHGRKCALICVNELLEDYSYVQVIRNANNNIIHSQRVYWQEVKQEIEKL